MTRPNDSSIDDIRRDIAANLSAVIDRQFWGLVAVTRGGESVFNLTQGIARDGVAISNDTLFEISSVSKQFTATAILTLRMRGELALDDTLERFFPAISSDKSQIRIADLLSHTSGFDPDFGLPYDASDTRDMFVAKIAASRLACRPGSRFDYANINYSLLAALVETVSGRDFEDFVRSDIFEPAGLDHTGFIGDPKLIGSSTDCVRVSHGRIEGTAADWYRGWGYRGMGGIVTSARDLLAWDRALREELILPDDAKRLMHTSGKGGYGFGWFIEPTGRGTTKAWHDGSVCGFECLFARYLEDEACIIVLSNEDADVNLVLSAIEDAVFARPLLTVSITPRMRFVNEGDPSTPGSMFTISEEGDQATLYISDGETGTVCALVEMPAGYTERIAYELDRCLEELPTASSPSAAQITIRKEPLILSSQVATTVSGPFEIVAYPAATVPLSCRSSDIVLTIEDADFVPLLTFELNVAAAASLISILRERAVEI
jgi:CubicO group peptidase (beta-lactamase class C family)